ncbi:MAG: HEAT repeat domain-containing protein [Gemmatimonadaceae bacterium]|nr:HEAT repeat domain-containing protein [Gemmatimonadaceae bacterium]
MTHPGLHARKTPTARTPDSGAVRVASEGRASRSVARGLGLLVGRLAALQRDNAAVDVSLTAIDLSSPDVSAVREALRQLTARSREGAMLCRVIEGTMILEGVPIDRQAAVEDPLLGDLLRALLTLDVGAITVREGAAPGELLTLGRLLAQGRQRRGTPSASDPVRSPRGDAMMVSDTPTTALAAVFADETPGELLRTWSVLVTPAVTTRMSSGASAATGSAQARLAAARTDDAAVSAVGALRDLLDDAQRRGDAGAIEGIARACLTHLHAVGESGGRLAVESALRQLQRAPVLDLLAGQLPHSTDRGLLLQLFARAGDVGVATLVRHLMTTDDSLSRRTFFDAIVAMDIGASELLDALHDSRWFVVRNASALLGEMRVEHADDTLATLLHHADERIRIAASRALMRLRTVKALQALQGVIDDSNAEVRRLAAAAFGLAGASGGAGVRPPAARLSAALERESDEDVALEMLAALGKLGSADAVQRLLRIALPASQDLSGAAASEPRDSWIRIAALEALIRARGPQMQPVIDSLRHDADAEVAAAAASLRAT